MDSVDNTANPEIMRRGYKGKARTSWKSAAALAMKSQTISHELAILEGAKETEVTGMTHDQILRTFQSFDKLLPELGAAARAMKLVRDELYDAVFSDEYTTGADGQVSPVPYFVLVNKIHRERNADADRANDTARSTAVELGEARAALAESKACLVALEAEKAVTEERLSEMKENSASLQDCVDRTDQRIAEAQEIADRAAAKQADRIAELEEELAATKADLADANIHRTSYKKMQAAFSEPHVARTAHHKEPGHKAVAMKQLAEARLTEEQMLGARNNVVADYEDFVCGIPMGAESATDEQARTLHTYETSITDITSELSQAHTFTKQLEAQIYELNVLNLNDFEATGKFSAQPGLLGRYTVDLKVAERDESVFKPLANFHRLCACCGAKTSDCSLTPKVPGNPIDLSLPRHATSIRIERVEPPPPETLPTKGSSEEKASNMLGDSVDKSSLVDSGKEKDGTERLYAVSRLRPQQKKMPRELKQAQVSRVLSEFVAATLEGDTKWLDDHASSAPSCYESMQHHFFRFLDARYKFPEVATAEGHNFLDAIGAWKEGDDDRRLMHSVLCGELDGAVARYAEQIRKSFMGISWVPPKDPESFSAGVLRDLYPHVKPDDFEELDLEFRSYKNANKLVAGSPEAFVSFIRNMLIGRREPHFVNVLSSAKRHITSTPGHMTLAECIKYGDAVNPDGDQNYLSMLFAQSASLAFLFDKTLQLVPVSRCAEIVAYIDFMHRAEVIGAAIAERNQGLSEWKRLKNMEVRVNDRDELIRADSKNSTVRKNLVDINIAVLKYLGTLVVAGQAEVARPSGRGGGGRSGLSREQRQNLRSARSPAVGGFVEEHEEDGL